ncbi:uncharacterized protein LOC144904193 [Branchiostoma floridae x Branchiostoma belcheri]
MRSPPGITQAAQTAAAGVKVQGNQGTPRRKRRSDSTLVEYYEKRGMTTGSVKDQLVQEAAKQTGKSPGQVVAFIKYRSKKKREQISPEGGSANVVSNASCSVAVETTTADSSGQDAASVTGQMPTARSAMDDQEGKRKEKTQTVKRPADTSGGPQDKRPAGEGSSLDGHPKDELAQLREENKTLKALVQKLQGSEKANRQDGLEEEVMSVLLVNGEYGTSHGGNSTTNRQVALYLKESGATVHATALQASEEDKQCAKDDKVILHLPVKKYRDKRTPSLEWLTFDHKSRYPDIPKNLKCIVGHSDVTSGAARSIQEDRCKLAKVVLFNHDIPEDTKAMEARKKMEDILEDAKNADAVFSLGKRIFHHFQTKYKSLGKSKPREHVLFRPKPSRVFEDISVGPGGGEKVVLFVGRVTKEEKLKGHDLVARSLGKVAEKIPNVRLWIRGIDGDDWKASEIIMEENMESGRIKPTLLPCGTQEDIAKDVEQAHLVLMPSRAEPFGLIGLEAIAAGIPVLISDRSGLADMIMDLIKEKKLPADMRHRIVKTSVRESDLGEDAREWAKKIEDTLEYSESEFARAAEFKKKLLESKYWEESHKSLLRVCGLID